MRLAIVLLAAFLPAQAEFVRITVSFQGTDCVSCTESLQGRLERVRGVESVKLDLEHNTVTLALGPGNRVRLTPLLSRITQDGTRITRTEVVARGRISREGNQLRFQPAGLTQVYGLRLGQPDEITLQDDAVHEVRGAVSEVGPGSEAVIEAVSVEVAAAR